MARRWALLGRVTPSRRKYRVAWCLTRNSAMTQTSSKHHLSTLVLPLSPASTLPHHSTVIFHGNSQVFSRSSSTPTRLPSSSQDSSRVYYAIHHHLRRSTFCLRGCLSMQHPVQCNILGHRSAGKCLWLLLTCLPLARTVAATISGMWSSCVPLPSHLLPAALPGCNIWCSSVPRDNRSMETSFLI